MIKFVPFGNTWINPKDVSRVGRTPVWDSSTSKERIESTYDIILTMRSGKDVEYRVTYKLYNIKDQKTLNKKADEKVWDLIKEMSDVMNN
jgi:hypothetical protein